MRSPLHEVHRRLGARFVDFGGWEMPVQYSSVIDEHLSVRSGAGWFDVSHLGRFSMRGPGVISALMQLLTNDSATLESGRSQYTLMLNRDGGIVDDLILWKWAEDDVWVLPNAANHEQVMGRFLDVLSPDTVIEDLRPSTVALAIQGPDAPAAFESTIGFAPRRFRTLSGVFEGDPVWTAGTGYTGERGGEVVVSVERAEAVVDAFTTAGTRPCGLGARDTLRLEAGLPLWGQDMDATVDPDEAGLSFAVDLGHEFVGREALERRRKDPKRARPVAFMTEGRKIPRHGMSLRSGATQGVVTSGNYSPILERGIGLGRIETGGGSDLELFIRGDWIPVTVVEPPFHRLTPHA